MRTSAGWSWPSRPAATWAPIHSVASFFVSRVDVEIDKRLDAVGTERAASLKGQAGIANARLAYQAFEAAQRSPRAQALFANGATTQRPLWASTGVKDPHTRDTLYVESLIAAERREHHAGEDPRSHVRSRIDSRKHDRRYL